MDSQKSEEETETDAEKFEAEFPRIPSFFAQVQQPAQSGGAFGVTLVHEMVAGREAILVRQNAEREAIYCAKGDKENEKAVDLTPQRPV